MNIVTAVRRRLRQESGLTGLARVDKFRLDRDVSGTGDLAVVVSLNGSWRETHQTAQFPRIGITIYADVSRDSSGEVTAEDAEDRIIAAWKQVDAVLHRPTMEAVWWGAAGESGVLVLFSNRETELSPIDHPVATTRVMRATYDLKVC